MNTMFFIIRIDERGEGEERDPQGAAAAEIEFLVNGSPKDVMHNKKYKGWVTWTYILYSIKMIISNCLWLNPVKDMFSILSILNLSLWQFVQ